MIIICDRCKLEVEADKGEDFTSGYYEVKAYPQFANENEIQVCDNCIWHDPRYIAVYGKVYSDV